MFYRFGQIKTENTKFDLTITNGRFVGHVRLHCVGKGRKFVELIQVKTSVFLAELNDAIQGLRLAAKRNVRREDVCDALVKLGIFKTD